MSGEYNVSRETWVRPHVSGERRNNTRWRFRGGIKKERGFPVKKSLSDDNYPGYEAIKKLSNANFMMRAIQNLISRNSLSSFW